jgi:hypothetical protein
MAWGARKPGDVSDLVRLVEVNELPQLSVLPMRQLGDEGAVNLAATVAKSTKLRSLHVMSTKLTVTGTSELLKAALASVSVKELRMVVEKIDEDHAAVLAAIITEAAAVSAGKGPLLESLSFVGCRLGDGALEVLAGALAGGVPGCDEPTPISSVLMLSHSAGTDSVWSSLAEACALTGVTSLRLFSVLLGDSGLAAFECLAEPPSKLQFLGMVQSQLGPVVEDAVGASGMSVSALEELASSPEAKAAKGPKIDTVFGADLGTYGRTEIPSAASALQRLCEKESLTELDLTMSRLTAPEQVAIMNGMVQRSRKPSVWGSRVTVTLSTCGMGDDGVLAVAAAAGVASDAPGAAAASGSGSGSGSASEVGLDVTKAQDYGLGVQLLMNGNHAGPAAVSRLAEVWQRQVQAAVACDTDAAPTVDADGLAEPRLLFRTINVGGATTVGTEAAAALIRSAGLALGQAHLMGATSSEASPPAEEVAVAAASAAASSGGSSARQRSKDEKSSDLLPAEKAAVLVDATVAAIARFQQVLPAGSCFGPDLRLSRGPMGGTGPGIDLSACGLSDDAGVAMMTGIVAITKPWPVTPAEYGKQVEKYRPAMRMVPGARVVTVIASPSVVESIPDDAAAGAEAEAGPMPAHPKHSGPVGVFPLQGNVHGPFVWLALSANECRTATVEAALPLHTWLRIASSK